MKDVVHLHSAGLDSTIVLEMLVQDEDVDDICLLFVDYGQKAEPLERELTEKCALHYSDYGLELVAEEVHLYDNMEHPMMRGGPKLEPEDYDEVIAAEKGESTTHSIPSIPSRNIMLLSIASATCERLGYSFVSGGFLAEEGTASPDNRPEFLDHALQALQPTCIRDILAPCEPYSQPELIEEGLRIGARIDLSTSCYNGVRGNCGQCRGCHIRSWAFGEVGESDPVER